MVHSPCIILMRGCSLMMSATRIPSADQSWFDFTVIPCCSPQGGGESTFGSSPTRSGHFHYQVLSYNPFRQAKLCAFHTITLQLHYMDMPFIIGNREMNRLSREKKVWARSQVETEIISIITCTCIQQIIVGKVMYRDLNIILLRWLLKHILYSDHCPQPAHWEMSRPPQIPRISIQHSFTCVILGIYAHSQHIFFIQLYHTLYNIFFNLVFLFIWNADNMHYIN